MWFPARRRAAWGPSAWLWKIQMISVGGLHAKGFSGARQAICQLGYLDQGSWSVFLSNSGPEHHLDHDLRCARTCFVTGWVNGSEITDQ